MAYLYQMNIERIQFAIVKYLRTRVIKIELQADHIISSTIAMSHLSDREKEYLNSFYDLQNNYLHQAFLSKLDKQSLADKVFSSKDRLRHAQPQLQVNICFHPEVQLSNALGVCILPSEGGSREH